MVKYSENICVEIKVSSLNTWCVFRVSEDLKKKLITQWESINVTSAGITTNGNYTSIL